MSAQAEAQVRYFGLERVADFRHSRQCLTACRIVGLWFVGIVPSTAGQRHACSLYCRSTQLVPLKLISPVLAPLSACAPAGQVARLTLLRVTGALAIMHPPDSWLLRNKHAYYMS